MQLIEEIQLAYENLEVEYAKFLAGNKTAGTRARACAQNIRRIAQEIRVHITEVKRG